MRRRSYPERLHTVPFDALTPVELVKSERDLEDLSASVNVSEGSETTSGGYWERALGRAVPHGAAAPDAPLGNDSTAVMR